MTKFKLTDQQQAFDDALLNTTSHLCLRARAGTGKTTTILESVGSYVDANPDHEVIVCAYNKAITDEIKEKLAKRGHGEWKQDPVTGRKIAPAVTASTAHSLGLSTFKWMFKPEINDKKVNNIVDATAGRINNEQTYRRYTQYKSQIITLVRMAKQAGFGFFPDLPIADIGKWYDLADHYDIDGLDDTTEAEFVVTSAQDAYRASLDATDIVDFDDMILFPLIKNIRVKYTKDLVIVDEAQDLNRARQALLRKFLKRGGRMIIVGDDRQAIYAFAGADATALHNLINQLDAEVLPLSVTWRCPKSIVALAQTIVPDIEAAPGAIEGEVLHVAQEQRDPAQEPGEKPARTVSWYETLEQPLVTGDAILCRNTAPLVNLAYKLIRAGTPCKVEGRSIGEGLKTLATRWKIKTTETLRKRLEAYKERERQKALAKGNESKAEEVEDRVTTIIEIIGACAEKGQYDIVHVVNFIDRLFADGATDCVILATYHRSKGREFPRVFLLEHSARCPSRAARQEWEKVQEQNLAYVAYTRAQESLVFVD